MENVVVIDGVEYERKDKKESGLAQKGDSLMKDCLDDCACATAPLPKWKSHKEVWADKIIKVKDNGPDCESIMPDDSHITWSLEHGTYVHVSNALKARGGDNPLGGYYVRYKDGYESWSPSEAFEEGYSRID